MCPNRTKGELLQEIEKLNEKLARFEDIAFRERERNKELQCLYNISQIQKKDNITIEEIIQGIIDTIPGGWQYPEITCARAIISGMVFQTEIFHETLWKLESKVWVSDIEIGVVEVFYLEKKPHCDNGPFLKEESDLLETICVELGRALMFSESQKRITQALSERDRILNQVKNSLTGITGMIHTSKSFKSQPISLTLGRNKEEPQALVEFLDVFANSDRLIIFDNLRTLALNLSEIKDLIGKSQSTTSHHIQAFRKIGIVVGWKRGKNMYFSINQQRMNEYDFIFEKWMEKFPFKIRKNPHKWNSGPNEQDQRCIMQFFSALANSERMFILNLLKERPHNLTSLEKSLKKSKTSLHHHIKILKENNLIEGTISGKFTNYKLTEKTFEKLYNLILNWFAGITNWLRRA